MGFKDAVLQSQMFQHNDAHSQQRKADKRQIISSLIAQHMKSGAPFPAMKIGRAHV